MTTLIAGTFGLDGIAVRQKIGTASHKKRQILGGNEAGLWAAWMLEQILKIHTRIGRAHRITGSLVGMERDT